MPVFVRFVWQEGTSNRFYADSWREVQDVIDDMSDDQREQLRAVHWPDDEGE